MKENVKMCLKWYKSYMSDNAKMQWTDISKTVCIQKLSSPFLWPFGIVE